MTPAHHLSAVAADTRAIRRAGMRSAAVTAAVLTAYGLAPLDRDLTGRTLAVLAGLLLGLVVVVLAQLRAVLRSASPRLRAFEAISLVLPLFLVLFAATYVFVSNDDAASFSEELGHVDSLYFTVTTFATVGFGDITPVSTLARLLVTAQMAAGLIAVGLVAKVFVDAVRAAEQGRSEDG